jgi:hypothetical protein
MRDTTLGWPARRGSVLMAGATPPAWLSRGPLRWLKRRVERGGWGLKPGHQRLVQELIRIRAQGTGWCCPTLETLAGLIGVNVRTVQRYLERLREVGLVWWENRALRVDAAAGWRGPVRLAQTSNSYHLQLPPDDGANCDGQPGQEAKYLEIQRKNKKKSIEEGSEIYPQETAARWEARMAAWVTQASIEQEHRDRADRRGIEEGGKRLG